MTGRLSETTAVTKARQRVIDSSMLVHSEGLSEPSLCPLLYLLARAISYCDDALFVCSLYGLFQRLKLALEHLLLHEVTLALVHPSK